MTLPNILTLARLFAVPLVIWLISRDYFAAAFAVFVAAGITDAVDGIIARAFNFDSALGRILDPLADKTLLVAVFIMLGLAELIPSWLVILAVSRDALIVGGVMVPMLLGQTVEYRPIFISKANTALQITLVGLVLAQAGFGWQIGMVIDILVYLVTVSVLLSAIGYLVRWVRHMAAE